MEALLFVLHVTHGSRLPTGVTEPNRGEERSERERRALLLPCRCRGIIAHDTRDHGQSVGGWRKRNGD